MSTTQSFNLNQDPSSRPVAGGTLDTDGITAVSLEVAPGTYPETGILKVQGTFTSNGLFVTEGLPWCDGGTTIVPYTYWNLAGVSPVLTAIVWADMTGVIVVPSGAQTPGACSVAVPTTPVMDSTVVAVPLGGTSVPYIFPANVKTVNVHNLTQDVVIVNMTFAVATTGSLTYHVGPGSSQAVDYDNTFMTQLTITDSTLLGNGGGDVLVNIIDD